MDKEIKSNTKYAISIHDIWIDLEERFNKEMPQGIMSSDTPLQPFAKKG